MRISSRMTESTVYMPCNKPCDETAFITNITT